MRLAVLSVAYPMAPCGPDAAGGAEQVLTRLDRALVSAGHTSVVVACEGSRVEGTLIAIPQTAGVIDEAAQRSAHTQTRAAIAEATARRRFDVVHLHGVDFHAYLPAEGPPALVTLHLPPSWYSPSVFAPPRRDTWLVCVSRSQRAACPRSAALLEPIANGVEVEALAVRATKRKFALALGRICPEKGYHIALDAAKAAGMPLVLAGELFRYPLYEDYFAREIAPRLDARRRFIGPVGWARKRRLLAMARCLVVPSLVPETSSLVAMEALASGTPVIAHRSGALPEVVEHGRTGFLVDGVAEIAEAMRRAPEIDSEACRSAARERFTAERMCAEYLALYRRLSARAEGHVA
jgi:glycosyltransferase involved in cell wall biosynthesis